MVYETGNQALASMEHALQISLIFDGRQNGGCSFWARYELWMRRLRNSNSRHDSDEWTRETVKCETSYCFPLAMEIIRFHYVRKDSWLLPAWIPNSTVRTSRKAARSLAFLVFLTKKSFLSCSAFCRWWQTTRYALSMQDKMAAWAFGRATNYGWDRPTVEIT